MNSNHLELYSIFAFIINQLDFCVLRDVINPRETLAKSILSRIFAPLLRGNGGYSSVG